MWKRVTIGFLTTVIFLVTVGVPVFQHDCDSDDTHFTRWFSFNQGHCEDVVASSCCSIEKKDCCNTQSFVVALKCDQESYFHSFVNPLKWVADNTFISSKFSFNFITKFSAIFNAVYHPPPRYGMALLKFLCVFRL